MSSSLSGSWCRADGWPLMFVCSGVIHQSNVGEKTEIDRDSSRPSRVTCVFAAFPFTIRSKESIPKTTTPEMNRELFMGNILSHKKDFFINIYINLNFSSKFKNIGKKQNLIRIRLEISQTLLPQQFLHETNLQSFQNYHPRNHCKSPVWTFGIWYEAFWTSDELCGDPADKSQFFPTVLVPTEEQPFLGHCF